MIDLTKDMQEIAGRAFKNESLITVTMSDGIKEASSEYKVSGISIPHSGHPLDMHAQAELIINNVAIESNTTKPKPINAIERKELEDIHAMESDLKPRTSVEWVERKFNAPSDAFKAIEGGDALYSSQSEHNKLENPCSIVERVKSGKSIYIRVEREVTWQDELIELLGSNNVKHTEQICMIPEEVIIKTCHLVASMTDKPE